MVAARAPIVSSNKPGPVTTGPESWAISPITPGEVDAIASFYAGFEQEKRPVEFWKERLKLWWQGNPAFEPGWPLGVKMTSGNRIVGVLCAVPVRTLHEGRQVVGAALTSWRVEKDFRTGSIGMLEAVLETHAHRPLFDTTPTPGVIRLLDHYGFDRPLKSFPAGRLLCNPWRLLTRALGAPPASIRDTLFFIDKRSAGVDEAAGLVDELWNRRLPAFDNMGVKDGAYFRWYSQPGRTNGRFGLVTTGPSGAATGMAIVLDMGKGVAWLADMWCDFGNAADVRQVVSTARHHVAGLGFHCLWVPHYQPSVAAACGRARVRSLPITAFFKMPKGTSPIPTSSYWTLAVGDFGA